MPSVYEISTFDTHTPFRCSIHHIGHIPTHMHDFFEIIFVLSGSCNMMIEDTLYHLNTDDILIVESHTLHELRSSNCVYASVQLDQTVLENNFPVPIHPKFECNSQISDNPEAISQLRSLVARLIQNNADKSLGYELKNWILIYQIMEVLFLYFRVERTVAVDKRFHRYAERISEISKIIKEHYLEDLPLSRLADMVHLSVPYLSKFFTEQFGMNYLSYITQLRVNHAVHELVNTQKNIEEISADSGFPNSHAFTQAFKKEYQMMPSTYRRRQLMERENAPAMNLEQNHYLAALSKYLQEPASVQPVIPAFSMNTTIDTSRITKTLRHTWRSTISVGKASDLLISDIQRVLRRAQKEIGYRYIFFNGIFSDDLHVCYRLANKQIAYNFSYVDRIFDFLLEIDLIPFLSFSYMPSALAKDKDRILFGHLVSEPASLNEWSGLVKAFLQHIMDRYGMNYVKKCCFSVWHQPNTPTVLYGFHEDTRFYHFYKTTYATAKDVLPDLCFGMPAIYGLFNLEWYQSFLEWSIAHDCRPDFLNFTFYDTRLSNSHNKSQDTFGFVYAMTLNTGSDGLRTFINDLKSINRTKNLDSLPVYVSEWNNTPSQQDLLNDTCYKSCYLVKNITENYDRLDSFSYWSLSDLLSETLSSSSFLFGGSGLFTSSGLPKANYYAFLFLRQLGDQFLARDEGWFATKSGSEIRIIAYHYVHYTELYALGEQFIMTEQNRYTMFESSQNLNLTLNLEHMENRSYSIRQYILNRESGSLFDTWADMGFFEPHTANDYHILESRSVPKLEYTSVEVTSHQLSLSCTLKPLEVRLIIVR